MPSPFNLSLPTFKQALWAEKKWWLRGAGLLIAALVIIWGGYRACTWISPPSVYRIGLDSTWYPLSLFGKEHSITAFSTDLLFSIAKDQKLTIELVRTGPKRVMDLLNDELVDGILTSYNPDISNNSLYIYSEPYYRFGAVLVIKKGTAFESLLQLHKKRIAVKRGSPVLYRISLDPTVTIIPYDSPLIAFEQLVKQQIDGIVMDDLLEFLYYGGLYRDEIQISTLPLTQEGLRLVALKGRHGIHLIERFNTGLKNLHETGVYQRLLNNWDLYNPEEIPVNSPP